MRGPSAVIAASVALRGGGAPGFVAKVAELAVIDESVVHAVGFGLFANSLAVLVSASLTAALVARQPRVLLGANNAVGRVASAVFPQVATFFAVYVAYVVVYKLTGFVPMGYVDGARPILSTFGPTQPLLEEPPRKPILATQPHAPTLAAPLASSYPHGAR